MYRRPGASPRDARTVAVADRISPIATRFVPFETERLLSTWENRVDYNLSESGVRPMTMRELIPDDGARESLADIELNYPQANGLPELRDRIATLYPGATRDNVLVTVGAIQANFTALLTVTDPGDDVAVMQPNYQQFWGLAQNLGRRLSTFALDPKRDWQLDLAEVARAVTPATTLVAVVNPNNPTGRVMQPVERQAVIDAARSADAWLLADEVYAGTEHRTDEVTPTFYGGYDKVLAVNSMSKAYGLPGLRIGWIVGPADVVERMWAWQDYITICTTMLGNKLAAIALSPSVRPGILARTRHYVREGFENLERWANRRGDVDVLAPDAAAISVVTYRHAIDSRELVRRLIAQQSTFVAPGALFGLENCLRVSFGLPAEYVNEGLRRLGKVLDSIT
ncbi:MAG TPA: aminotransferase class I/II-fold pyridoxal phosphate-dependent enzyme [Candidatus Tumulicola sp.]